MGWYDPDWTQRIEITVQASKVVAGHTGYVVFIDLADLPSTGFWDGVKDDGADIRVTTSDGETECPQDVVSCDTALETGEMYFRAPLLSSSTDTKFYIYINNPSAYAYAFFSTNGANDCWVDYLLVSHDGMGSRANDNFDTVFDSEGITTSSGKIGDAGDYPNDPRPYIRLSEQLEDLGFDEVTVSCWAKTDDKDVPNQVIFHLYGNSDDYFYFWLDDNSRGLRTYREWNGVYAYRCTTNWVPTSGVWFYTAWTADGTNWKTFVDGTEKVSDSESMDPTDVTDDSPTFYIGGRAWNDRFWGGQLDEVRIRYGAVSLEWHQTEYNNLSSPSTFYTAGDYEAKRVIPLATLEDSGFSCQVFPIFVPLGTESITKRSVDYQSSILQVPLASAIINPTSIYGLHYEFPIPLARITINPRELTPFGSVTTPQSIIPDSPLRPWTYWTADPTKVQTIFLFVLTGSANGESDITIPISSCQMRRRDGDPTYMSVMAPDYDTYADAIAARADGEMVFYKGVRFQDDSTQTQEIARVNLEDIRLDKGPKNRSITLSGHKTVSTTDPNIVDLSGASYRNLSDGIRRYRSEVDLWIRPGDTANIDGESFQVGYISYTIGVGQEVMEVVEASEVAAGDLAGTGESCYTPFIEWDFGYF